MIFMIVVKIMMLYPQEVENKCTTLWEELKWHYLQKLEPILHNQKLQISEEIDQIPHQDQLLNSMQEEQEEVLRQVLLQLLK